jgi:hypothetical protein
MLRSRASQPLGNQGHRHHRARVLAIRAVIHTLGERQTGLVRLGRRADEQTGAKAGERTDHRIEETAAPLRLKNFHHSSPPPARIPAAF